MPASRAATSQVSPRLMAISITLSCAAVTLPWRCGPWAAASSPADFTAAAKTESFSSQP
ncbi:hypothetical protein ACFQ51_06035 [Streptomyces kaempferi]